MKSRENQARQSISLKLLISQNKRQNDVSKSISEQPFKTGVLSPKVQNDPLKEKAKHDNT